MAKNQTCDNWLAKLMVCANVMISDKSLHISTLKNVMCEILLGNTILVKLKLWELDSI
jgi:hypothetical protein